MDDATFEQAQAMLVDDPPIADNVAPPVVDDVVVEETVVDAPTSYEESFAKVDPSTLPPELQAIYKSMQSDYTRKAQEVAEYRKIAAATGGDVAALQRAYEFFNRMDTDPQYAKQVAEYVLERTGGATAPVVPEPEADDFDFDENVPSALQREIDELRKWREDMEQERVMDQMSRLVLQQETQLRQANPHYDQDDIDAVYEIAASMEVPDLIQAEERYTALQARWATRMLANKAATGAPTPPVAGTFSQEVTRPATLADATAMGLDMILGQNGQ